MFSEGHGRCAWFQDQVFHFFQRVCGQSPHTTFLCDLKFWFISLSAEREGGVKRVAHWAKGK